MAVPATGEGPNASDGVRKPRGDTGLLERARAPRAPSNAERWRARKLWLKTGHRAETHPPQLGLLEDPDPNAVGICCSGGGIRSAAFNLGALQALQAEGEHGRVLQDAKYLAAVSGGSYIAAAFSMVAKTSPGKSAAPASASRAPSEEGRVEAGAGESVAGIASQPVPEAADPEDEAPVPDGPDDIAMTSEDTSDDSNPNLVKGEFPPFYPRSPEEQYLRNHSSYMAPTGFAKAYLAFRILSGLLFNVLLLGLPLFAAGVFLAAVVYRPAYPQLAGASINCPAPVDPERCSSLGSIPPWILWTLGGLAIALGLLGFLSLVVRWQRDIRREAVETWIVRLLLAIPLLAILLLIVPVLIGLLRDLGASEDGAPAAASATASLALPAVGAGTFASLLLAVFLQLRAAVPRPTPAQTVGAARKVLAKATPRLRLWFAYVAGALAGPLLLLAFLVLGASEALARSTATAGAWALDAIVASLGVFGLVYFFADLNAWSLHPLYRRRLCSAFALKRVTLEGTETGQALERDYDRLVPLSKSGVEPGAGFKAWPTLLVCAAANVSDPGATPPGRGVTSFTFSPTAIGGPLVGGTETGVYERALGCQRLRDITLPAAVAMSGAALSPSMGKMTVRPLRFLMALANVRLGVWVPNPRYLPRWRQRGLNLRKKAPRQDVHEGPSKDVRRDLIKQPRPSYLIRELLGRNRLDARFLYVSDGGHYENLGLVELLRRGCTRIYCFDASGGKSASALGDAVALARSELGVEIEIDPRPVLPQGEAAIAERDSVKGKIRYPKRGGTHQEGTLVYARTVMTQDVPWDVAAFRDLDPRFPNHSTADQLYTDQKFEAYRALGHQAGEHARAAMENPLEPASADRKSMYFRLEMEATVEPGSPRHGLADETFRRPPAADGVYPRDHSMPEATS